MEPSGRRSAAVLLWVAVLLVAVGASTEEGARRPALPSAVGSVGEGSRRAKGIAARHGSEYLTGSADADGDGRRLVYKTAELRRTEACLSTGAVPSSLYSMIYNGSSWSVSIAYPNWASARILGEIHYILMTEVLRYEAHLFDTNAIYSSHPINYAAGCRDGDETTGDSCNVERPLVHYTVETWMAGYRRTAGLPSDIRPSLLRTLDYPLLDQFFIWADMLEKAKESECKVLLDDYRAYQSHSSPNGTSLDCFEASRYFDNWLDVYEKLGPEVLSECSVMDAEVDAHSGGARLVDRYVELTGDASVACLGESGYADRVWFSKSCRSDPSRCIPLVIQYTMDFAMQISYFLELPVAVMMVTSGKSNNYREYYDVILSSNLMFGWYTPDDSLLRLGKMPVTVAMPPTNTLEHQQGIYKTGLGVNSPRNFAWRNLPFVDPHVTKFAGEVNLYSGDIDALMVRSRQLKNLHAGNMSLMEPPEVLKRQGFTSAHPVDEKIARMVACEWLVAERKRWLPWIPAICNPGSVADETLTECVPCQPGYYCRGGTARNIRCPEGSYCPGNSTVMPITCPYNLTTSQDGAASQAECDSCPPASVWLGGNCLPTAFVVLAFAGPITFVLVACVSIGLYLRWRKLKRAYVIDASEIEIPARESAVGQSVRNKTRSCVFLGTYRGQTVAVKVMLTPNGRADFAANDRRRPSEGMEASAEEHLDTLRKTSTDFRQLVWSGGSKGSNGLGSRSGEGGQIVDTSEQRSGGRGLWDRVKGICISKPTETDNANFVRQFRRAMREMCQLRHNHISTPLGFCVDADRVLVVMEFNQYGSLYDILHNETIEFNDDMAVEILHDITAGMLFLHDQKPAPVLHGYLSSTNILLDRNLNARVADGGYPRVGQNIVKKLAYARSILTGPRQGKDPCVHDMMDDGSLASAVYMAPEVLVGMPPDLSSDIYAFGILIYELIARQDPYANSSIPLVQVLCEIADGVADLTQRLQMPPDVNASLAGISRDCSHLQGEFRPTFREVERRVRGLMTDSDAFGDAQSFTTKSAGNLLSWRQGANSPERFAGRQSHSSARLVSPLAAGARSSPAKEPYKRALLHEK